MKNYQNLLQKKLTRFEFLKMVGVIILTITGVSGILKTISGLNTTKVTNGFGKGVYGQ